MWRKQFLAVSGKREYKDVLTGVTNVPAANVKLDPTKVDEDKDDGMEETPKDKG